MAGNGENSSRVDSTSKNSALVYHESYERPAASSSSQPFLFRQFTFREFFTPTKQGNISMKAVSFGVWSRDKLSPAVSKSLSLGFDFPSSATSEANVWASVKTITGFFDKKNHVRSRSRVHHPAKKVKVGSIYGEKKISSDHEDSEEGSRNKQGKDVEKLHWKYICIISLLPLLIFVGVRWPISGFIWPVYEENPIQQEWNLKHLNETVSQRVFGQKEAISSLLSVLDNFLNKDMAKKKQLPVILISGSSGVGKSFMSSIVSHTFPPPGKAELVIQIPPPPPELILKRFNENHLNLIVVDSLTHHSIADAIKWAQNVFNVAIWQNKQILVILIYNIQVKKKVWNAEATYDMPSNLRATGEAQHEKLLSAGLDSHHIHLDPLDKEHVKECIRTALEKRGLHNDPNAEKHVEHISSLIKYRHEGCKPVWNHTASVVLFD